MFLSLDHICKWLLYFAICSANLMHRVIENRISVIFCFLKLLKFEISAREKKTVHLGFKVILSIFSNAESVHFML